MENLENKRDSYKELRGEIEKELHTPDNFFNLDKNKQQDIKNELIKKYEIILKKVESSGLDSLKVTELKEMLEGDHFNPFKLLSEEE